MVRDGARPCHTGWGYTSNGERRRRSAGESKRAELDISRASGNRPAALD